MSKRTRNVVSYEEAVADIIEWVDNEGDVREIDELIGDNDSDVESGDERAAHIEINDPENELYEEEIDEQPNVQRHRKLLTRNRKVNSIDSSLNEENFDPIHYVNRFGHWETLTGYLGPKNSRQTETIQWNSDLQLHAGRQRTANVIRGPVLALRGAARSVETIQDCFDLFFDETIFERIITKTNMRINRHLDKLREHKKHIFESSKYSWLKETSYPEMRALIGLIYLRGLYGMNHRNIELLFAKHIGHDIFGATMSQQRMKFLLANITFDDPEERAQNWPSDRFAAARPLFEQFNKNCSKYVYPSEYLSLDETLYPMRHQIAFRQYNPNKPHKYGLLVKSLNDARVPFTYKAVPYSGKPENGDGPYYIDNTEQYVKYLVNETEKDISLHGRNISTDRLYTSIPLANWLLDRHITTVGTLNTNRIGIPDELKNTKDRNEFSVTCHLDESKKIYLTTYSVRTKSKGKKNVMVLSTMRPLQGVTIDDGKKKPAIIKFYDFTKGGTDIVDQINDFHTCCTQTYRWDLVLFYILDTIKTNSKTVWCLKNKKDISICKSFQIVWDLANSFVKPFIENRCINGLPNQVIQKIENVLEKKVKAAPETSGKIKAFPYPYRDERRRCKNCEKGSSKAEKSNLPKTKEHCESCGISVCRDHSIRMCNDCVNKI